MSREINIVLEMFDKQNNVWKLFKKQNELNFEQNSYLFDILADAGKTDYFEPIFYQKGIPENLDPLTLEWIESYDEGHSHSYLTIKQILEYPYWNQTIDKLNDTCYNLVGKNFWIIINSLKDISDAENIRFVFFFDD